MATLGEAIREYDQATAGLPEASKQWLTAALDPFHDTPLHLNGYPGLQSRKTITTVYKTTFSLESQTSGNPSPVSSFKPVQLGAQQTLLSVPTNDVNIQYGSVLTSAEEAFTMPYVTDLPPSSARPFNMAQSSPGAWAPAPLTVWWTQPDGSSAGYRVFPKLPDIPFRVVATGLELKDTTPEMYRQGLLYVSSAPLSKQPHTVWLQQGGTNPDDPFNPPDPDPGDNPVTPDDNDPLRPGTGPNPLHLNYRNKPVMVAQSALAAPPLLREDMETGKYTLGPMGVPEATGATPLAVVGDDPLMGVTFAPQPGLRQVHQFDGVRTWQTNPDNPLLMPQATMSYSQTQQLEYLSREDSVKALQQPTEMIQVVFPNPTQLIVSAATMSGTPTLITVNDVISVTARASKTFTNGAGSFTHYYWSVRTQSLGLLDLDKMKKYPSTVASTISAASTYTVYRVDLNDNYEETLWELQSVPPSSSNLEPDSGAITLAEIALGHSGRLGRMRKPTPPATTSSSRATRMSISSSPVPATWVAPSRAANRSVVMQDTTEWPLWKGAYVVPRMINEPEWDAASDLDSLNAVTASLSSGSFGGREILVGLSPDRRYWSLTNGSTSGWAECTLNVVGANFNPVSTSVQGETQTVNIGTNPGTKLVVTLVYYCEMLPPTDDTTLLTLAKPAAMYDPDVLRVYSAARAGMPLATPVKNNSIGGWLMLVASLVGAAIRATAKIKQAYQKNPPGASAALLRK